MLQIISNYHRMQFQGKLMILTKEKPHFGLDLGPLGHNAGSNSYHLEKKCVSFIQLVYSSKVLFSHLFYI